jgi:dienelactone hydrolase
LKTPLCFLLFIAHTFADAPKPLPATNPWDLAALSRAPKVEWRDEDKPIRSLFYSGEPFEGKPTKVFAYYASPATLGTDKEAGKKFPAVVLVHGGGGNAFEQWVQHYAKRGYAAISMDLAGCWKSEPDKKPERHADAGPDQSDTTKFKETPAPHHDQWTYHAVADVLLAHSLLLTLPEVDNNRTGVTGISWGGYLTCIVAGVDPRFKVAVPQYGCGFLQDNSAWSKQHFDPTKPEWPWRQQWVKLWDPSSYVGSATMPMLFINGSNDFAYPVDSYMKTYALVKSPKNIAIKPAMPHGHIFDVPEVFTSIDAVLQGGVPLGKVIRCASADGKVTAEVESKTPLAAAELHFTTAPHPQNPKREWTKRPLSIEGMKITGEAAPSEATAWYVSIKDERGLLISSEVTIH